MKNVCVKTLAAAMLMAALSSCVCPTGPRHYDLSENDSGRTLHLDCGDTFTVTLESNPTTGYQWKIGTPPYDNTVIILHEDKYIPPQGELCGAPGKSRLTFLAKHTGRTGLRLIYVRPWEKDRKPANEFNLMVVVKGDPESKQ